MNLQNVTAATHSGYTVHREVGLNGGKTTDDECVLSRGFHRLT